VIPARAEGRIASSGAADGSALAVVVGNTKALWEPFQEAQRAPKEAQELDPLDSYVEHKVNAAVEEACRAYAISPRDVLVYFSHHTQPGKIVAIQVRQPTAPASCCRALELRCAAAVLHLCLSQLRPVVSWPAQRAAHIAGLAYLDGEMSHLSIHPTFGPWISLRALVVVQVLQPPAPGTTKALNDPVAPGARQHIGELMALAIASFGSGNKLSQAQPTDPESVAEPVWMPWLRARDAVASACMSDEQIKEHRFCEEQILFHYQSR